MLGFLGNINTHAVRCLMLKPVGWVPLEPKWLQPLLAPGQQNMERSEATLAAYRILEKHDRLQMRQMRQMLEAMTGFEKNNKYMLRDSDGKDVFFIKENSTCLERTFAGCAGGLCKQWRMDIFLMGERGIEGGLDTMTPFMHLERPCHATVCCLNRPEVVVTDAQTGTKIGTIREPMTCCSLKFEVLDAADQPVLNVVGSSCQCGLLCPLPCDGIPCQVIDFPITDFASGSQVALIEKKWRWGDLPLLKLCSKEWDDYWIDFKDAKNPDFKVLLLSAAIFVQMRFFDQRNANN